MADYSTIKGFTVQTLATDPSAPGVAGAAWSSGGALGTGVQYAAGAGTLTAGLVISGADPTKITTTQEYDGTTWTNGGAVTTARVDAGSAGTQTSALVTGGTAPPGPTAVTEEYDGTSWTAGGSLSRGAGRGLCGSCGATQDAAWVAGGRGSPDFNDLMETYNGTSWTETNDLNTGRAYAMGAGTTTAGILFGGMTGDPSLTGNTDVTETWDGTSWSTSPATLNSTRREAGGSGTQTLALCFGGVGPPSNEKKAVAEAFDGTSWTEVADMATARLGGAPSKLGTQTASFYAGGDSGSISDATEEFTGGTSIAQEGQVWYNSTSAVLKGFAAVGPGAWASGTAPPTATYGRGSAGTATAGLQFAGYNNDTTAIALTTETYDGSTWTEVADSSTGGSYCMGCGTQTAAFAAGASSPLSSALAQTWDGTSWTAGPAFLTQRYGGGGGGITTSAVYTGGWMAPGMSDKTEKWDGTSWTEVNQSLTARTYVYCSGSSDSDAMISGGSTPGSVSQALVETYNGTSWTETTNLPETMKEGGGMGTGSTSAIVFGGLTPVSPLTAASRTWDGTSWTEVGALGTGRQTINQGGNTGATGALCLGGYPSPAANLTEEYTAGNAIKTFTAS